MSATALRVALARVRELENKLAEARAEVERLRERLVAEQAASASWMKDAKQAEAQLAEARAEALTNRRAAEQHYAESERLRAEVNVLSEKLEEERDTRAKAIALAAQAEAKFKDWSGTDVPALNIALAEARAEVERRLDQPIDQPTSRPDVYALLIEYFGSNLRGEQQTLHYRLSSIVAAAEMRADALEAEAKKLRARLEAEVQRLEELNRRQWGCEGRHRGIGTPTCPFEPHHHHDDRCIPGLTEQITKLRALLDKALHPAKEAS